MRMDGIDWVTIQLSSVETSLETNSNVSELEMSVSISLRKQNCKKGPIV